MKNIKTNHTSSGGFSGLSSVISILLIAAVCIGGTFLLTSRFYQQKTAEQSVDEMSEQGTVLMVSADLPEGSYAADAATPVTLPLTQIPENAVTSVSEIDGLVTKLHLAPNTILTSDMLVGVDMDEDISDTSRQIAVSFVKLESQIEAGDYIDIHIKTYSTDGASGYTDQIVLSKKKVLAISGNTLYMNLDQEEQLALNVASVQASAKRNGNDSQTVLYGIALVSPAQPKAIEDYHNDELTKLIQSDPNLIRQAQDQLSAGNE